MSLDERNRGSGHRVLMTSGIFEPGFKGGGPIRSIAQVIDTAPADVHIYLVTKDRDEGARSSYPGLSGNWAQRGSTQIFYLNTKSVRQWWRLLRDLRSVQFDLLYANSFWAPMTTVIPVLASLSRLLHVPTVLIAPRGELSNGALSVKTGKKAAFLPWWRRILDQSGVIMHATAPHEAEDIRRIFPRAKVLLVSNQTALPAEPLGPSNDSGKRTKLVYISRISINKQLHVALEGLHHVANPVSFDIWGPIESKRYWSRCQKIIAALPGHVHVAYRGPLCPTEVRSTFSRYDAFVFPTTGENFGHAIAESLSASCPVFSTDQTPWTGVLERGGGIALSNASAYCFGLAMDRLTGESAAQRQTRRLNAGAAYKDWRKGEHPSNVLDVALRKSEEARP